MSRILRLIRKGKSKVGLEAGREGLNTWFDEKGGMNSEQRGLRKRGSANRNFRHLLRGTARTIQGEETDSGGKASVAYAGMSDRVYDGSTVWPSCNQ